MRNALIATAIVLLAVLSAPRLALDFTPRPPSSQIVASIRFPAAASSDPVDVTTRYVLPLETAIRSLGDVVATRGDVGADGVSMTIRFRRGVDAELKAARLISELAPLRARLPEGSDVGVWPSGDGGGDESAIVALTERDAGRVAERVADELRATPGVREVTTFGAAQDEVDVRAFGDAPPDFARAISRALTPRLLGKRVLAAPTATRLRDARVNGNRLESIATIRERQAEPRLAAHLDGREAVLLSIVRDDDVPLFDFDRAIRRTLAGRNVTFVSSDAAELRALLVRVGIGALLAMLILALVDWRLAFYIPVAFAIVINVCRIASLRVDATSLLAACIAIAATTAIAVGRQAEARATSPALFALLPLIAVSLASNALASVLVLPARMFAIAAIASLAASMLIRPSPIANGQSRGRLERRLLRASASIVLAAIAASTFLFSWCGDRLDPRQPVRSTQRSRLFVHLGMPAGTPLAPTLAALKGVERGMRSVNAIWRFWSFVQPGRATVIAEVAPDFQRPDTFELLQLRLRAAMPLASGVVTVDTARAPAGAAFDGGLEEKTFADEKSNRYRVLLKGTDAEAMRRALESIVVRLGGQGIRRADIIPGWAEAAIQVTLVPRPGIAPATATQLAQSLAELTLPPRPHLLPDGRTLVAASADAPRRDDDVPRAADLFARPLPMTVDTAFDVRREPVRGRVTRELGRFVLPVDILISGWELEQRKQSRANIDRSLSLMQFPAGIVLERPSLAQWDFSTARLRLFGLAALLPALLFALAAVVLSSLRRALAALAPALLGVACTAPVLMAIDAPVDELALLAIGAAVSLVTAMATIALLRFTSIAATYRTLRAALVPCAIATLAGAVMLGVAGTGGRELGDVWRVPLYAACVVLAFGGAAALILPAAFLSFRAKRGIPRAHFADRGSIAVQNLTKVYAGGFRALHRISFELEPGVIGLLGPNGAGKTTLLRILTGLLLPTRGVVRFGGVDVKPESLAEYRRRIGFLPQEFNAYAGLTAAQFLDYWALERGIGDTRARRDEVDRLLAIARLEAHAGRKLRDFSGGMRQRIGIARAMIGNPPLLVVDEPTTGLDIEARGHFRDLITSIARDRIVILSTHIASDVETTASRLLLLSRGRLVWDGAPDALLTRARGRIFETIAGDAEARELTRLYRITTRVRLATGVRLRGIVADGEPLPGASVDATLEEAYLAEIGARAGASSGSFAFVYEG